MERCCDLQCFCAYVRKRPKPERCFCSPMAEMSKDEKNMKESSCSSQHQWTNAWRHKLVTKTMKHAGVVLLLLKARPQAFSGWAQILLGRAGCRPLTSQVLPLAVLSKFLLIAGVLVRPFLFVPIMHSTTKPAWHDWDNRELRERRHSPHSSICGTIAGSR